MDVQAENSALIREMPGLVRVELQVSNPATSSYLAFQNLSTEPLALMVTMWEGVPVLGSSPHPGTAVGSHRIPPGESLAIAYHVPYGNQAAQNTWRTDYAVIALGSGPRTHLTFRAIVVNAPGLPSINNNWTTIQVM